MERRGEISMGVAPLLFASAEWSVTEESVNKRRCVLEEVAMRRSHPPTGRPAILVGSLTLALAAATTFAPLGLARPAAPEDLTVQVEAILKEQCSPCHNNQNAPKGVNALKIQTLID